MDRYSSVARGDVRALAEAERKNDVQPSQLSGTRFRHPAEQSQSGARLEKRIETGGDGKTPCRDLHRPWVWVDTHSRLWVFPAFRDREGLTRSNR